VTSDVPITDNSVLVLTYPTVDGDLLIDGVTEEISLGVPFLHHQALP